MPDKAFLDTNILVYAFSSDSSHKAIATDLIIRGATIGVQALNEFVNVEKNKFRVPLETLLEWLQIIDVLCPPPIPVTLAVHRRAVQIMEDRLFHIYDSLLLAAAIEASCTTFYSEDLQDGQVIDTLTIRNPFRHKKTH